MSYRSLIHGSAVGLLVVLLGGPCSTVTAQDQDGVGRATLEKKEVDPVRLRAIVEQLAGPRLKGRGSFETRKQAADELEAEYRRLKLQPLFDKSYQQVIPGKKTPEGQPTQKGQNVGAWLPGSDPVLKDEFIIISAHYDHLGEHGGEIYFGADDNASSVAMVLEAARLFARQKPAPRRSIAFVNFDLEEQLLWGSRWFAAHPPWPLKQVKFFVTADLLGRSLGDLPLPAVFAMGAEHSPELRTILDEVGAPKGLEVVRLGSDFVGTRSDYGAFRDADIPFLFFSTGEHPDYHTPRDTPDKLDYTKLAGITTVIIGTCKKIADADTPPAWQPRPEPDLEEAKALHRITELLLEAEEKRPLTSLQRLLVTQVNTKTKQMIERGKFTDDERNWLIRSAQLLLVSVF